MDILNIIGSIFIAIGSISVFWGVRRKTSLEKLLLGLSLDCIGALFYIVYHISLNNVEVYLWLIVLILSFISMLFCTYQERAYYKKEYSLLEEITKIDLEQYLTKINSKENNISDDEHYEYYEAEDVD